ncbi:MAG TPA: DUF4232 domain-containing protein [Pseudolysinimonas sp.]|nr:DUF4232 domain-containing protein [Pseudolysinimonas sp.]
MFRLAPGLRAGLAASGLWLASALLFAAATWVGLYRGDAIRLVLIETIPVGTWQLDQPWPVVIAVTSLVAFGAAVAWGVALLHRAASSAPRGVLLLATWLVVVLAGAAAGGLTGVGAVIGTGVPRAAFFAQGVPDAIALGTAAGLVFGWMPAWLALPPRRSGEAVTASVAPSALGAVALVAAIALTVSTALVVADARQAGLAGEAPPSVVQPEPEPVPTGTPPPPVAPGEHPSDPSWCTPSQLTLVTAGADAATGHRAATLRATNTSADGCVLPGYPDVAFADEHGMAVGATVRYGGGFMTEDPGPAPFRLEPGADAIAFLAWDVTDGRTMIAQLYLAPYPGAQRTLCIVQPGLDITALTEVAVTAWAPKKTD